MAIDSARGASPTLLRLRKALESAQANVGAQQSTHKPNVDLVANVDRSQFYGSATSSQSPSAGLEQVKQVQAVGSGPCTAAHPFRSVKGDLERVMRKLTLEEMLLVSGGGKTGSEGGGKAGNGGKGIASGCTPSQEC